MCLVFTRQECQRQTHSLHWLPVFCLNLSLVDEPPENRRGNEPVSKWIDQKQTVGCCLSGSGLTSPQPLLDGQLTEKMKTHGLLTAAGWLHLTLFYDLASSRLPLIRGMCIFHSFACCVARTCRTNTAVSPQGVSQDACCRALPACSTSSCAAFGCVYAIYVHLCTSLVHWVGGQLAIKLYRHTMHVQLLILRIHIFMYSVLGRAKVLTNP